MIASRRLLLGIVVALAATIAAPPASAAQRLAVLTPTAPWSPECQGTGWRKDRDLRERCPVLETLADEARAGALAALRGRDVAVMTRENTAQLLKAMGSSAACTAEGECEVETAKLIGAHYVVSGNVTLVERTWLVTLKLHEVETAKLLETGERLEGATQLAMIKAVRPAAEALVRTGLATAAGTGQEQPQPSAADPVRTSEGPPPLATRVWMARLPGGTYAAGATGRSVSVQPFLLDVTEVTVAAYGECVKAGRCSRAFDTAGWIGMSDADRAYWSKWSPYCNQPKPKRANHPINCVDWQQASAYCAAVGKRLPTEEEWEWAARGAERGTTYPWGDDPPGERPCWDGGDVDRIARKLGTCEVGSHPGDDSPQGVKDLAGNVLEWTSSVSRRPGEAAEAYVHRGGAWSNGDPPKFAAGYRSTWPHPQYRNVYIGFRCAKDAE